MTKKHHDTTTTSTTTTTTVPETTVPPTTVSECDFGVCGTVPETTTPVTTAPECNSGVCGTVPEATVPVEWGSPALTDVCLQHITGGPTLQPGEYVYVDSVDKATGTTERFVGLCAPVPTAPPTLPATGGETGWIALVALVMLLTGVSVVATVRRAS
jgi:LPXTG-motif cell wall-anchored protein